MRLLSIQLTNIGLYKNEIIRFPAEEKKSTMIFWGNNGAGKTTFINAVKISLLGKDAFQMSYPDYCQFIKNKIISTRSTGDKLEAGVSVEIEIKINNQNKSYFIKRHWIVTGNDFVESVSVVCDGNTLDYEKKERILNIISRLLPPSLLDVIIFDGENAINILNNGDMGKLIRSIIFSVFGMDVYAALSKDLNTFLRSGKSNSSRTTTEQYEFLKLESDYKIALNNYQRVEKLLSEEINSRTAKIREASFLAKKFSEKTGISIDGIEKINENIANSESEREKLNAEIRYISEEILPLKLVHSRIKKIISEIEQEKPFTATKYIKELRKLLSNFDGALDLLTQLEDYLPEGDRTLKHDLSDHDLNTLLNTDSILNKYSKKSMLDVLDNKNDFLKEAKKQLEVSSKVNDQESQEIIKKLEALYGEIEISSNMVANFESEKIDAFDQLDQLKKSYDLAKAAITKQKKESSSYITAMQYRDSIDLFISNNISRVCKELNEKIGKDLTEMNFRNGSIKKVEISTKTFDLELYESGGKIIPSHLFSAGEKQVLLGLVIKEALSISKIDTFFLFDTPVGRLDVGNRSVFTKQVIFNVAEQVAIFATDSDYSKEDYQSIKDSITKEVRLLRDENDEIVVADGGIYDQEGAKV